MLTEEGTIIISPVLCKRKLRCRGVKWLAQGHTAGEGGAATSCAAKLPAVLGQPPRGAKCSLSSDTRPQPPGPLWNPDSLEKA